MTFGQFLSTKHQHFQQYGGFVFFRSVENGDLQLRLVRPNSDQGSKLIAYCLVPVINDIDYIEEACAALKQTPVVTRLIEEEPELGRFLDSCDIQFT